MIYGARLALVNELLRHEGMELRVAVTFPKMAQPLEYGGVERSTDFSSRMGPSTMQLLFATMAGFVVALLAPLIARVARGATGWCLALVPLLSGLFFTRQLPRVVAGEALTFHYAWAPQLGITLAFHLDGLALLFTQLICYIGALVFVYAGAYLHGENFSGRLYVLLLIFMSSMLGLVLADNLLCLFVFWELTSISSYLLIGFHHDRPEARSSALQALLVTAGGGLALLAGFVLWGTAAGTYEISALIEQADLVRSHALFGPGALLVLIGAFTKSAQFPFHFWLPAAMEAPTPVSAYLHSATMVKAGIYLIARLTPLAAPDPVWTSTLIVIGATTMILGAWLALHPNDLKQLLAYLTVSALGMLTMLLGIGEPMVVAAAMTYLLGHALYKGGLFLVAGAIDHSTGTRDIRALGGLWRAMPMTAIGAFLAAGSMMGLMPLVGFIAKESVYEAALEHAPMVVTALLITANAAYVAVALLLLRPFWGRRRDVPQEPPEGSMGLWLGPLVLGLLALVLGLATPAHLDDLLSVAASNVVGRKVEVHLALWHGWNTALVLSLITLAAGTILYAGLRPLNALLAWWERLGGWGPARLYDLTLAVTLRFASWQTRILQHDNLRNYFLVVLLTLICLPGFVLMYRQGFAWPDDWNNVLFYEAALATLVLGAAIVAIRARTRLSAIAAMGVVGFGVALIFVIFGAPDVAMTQFIVETLTVILFVLVFYHLPETPILTTRLVRLRDALVGILVGTMMTLLVLTATAVQFSRTISSYYLETSLPVAHGRNIVNVILVDFRALDTLGEITVLSVAGAGVYSLLRLRNQATPPRDERAPKTPREPAEKDLRGGGAR